MSSKKKYAEQAVVELLGEKPAFSCFASINKGADVWWAEPSYDKAQVCEELVLMLLAQNRQLHVLQIPTAFLRQNLAQGHLETRTVSGKKRFALHISCKERTLYRSERPVNRDVSFRKFHTATLPFPNAES